MEKDSEPPSAKLLDEGYNQTYVIQSNGSKMSQDDNEVLFRCGNWCYKGRVQFNGLKFSTAEVPVLIPTLQRQQGSLRYYCNAKNIPNESEYNSPLHFMEESLEFVASELTSTAVEKELHKMSQVFPWINDDTSNTYFELTIGNLPTYMEDIALIASKTYTRGLIIIAIYLERTIYFLIQEGEGDQPLLDVRFPDVSKHGQGLHLNSYNEEHFGWKKLTLWNLISDKGFVSSSAAINPAIANSIPKIKTINLASSQYEQTYCILKSSCEGGNNGTDSQYLSVYHDALFRFGSWCYTGRVQLTPTITLADIPYVIPALRMQQNRLDYYCDVNFVPTTSPYAAAMGYLSQITPLLEQHLVKSEESLQSLITRLTSIGLGDSVKKWLDSGSAADSFYEFKLQPDRELTEKIGNVEVVVSKAYYASGTVTVIILYQYTVYVTVLENNAENPLLDSRFPDISGKGRGYQLEAFNQGTTQWPELRKVSIWQTVSALEQEFRENVSKFAQSKATDEKISTASVDEFDDIESTNSKEREPSSSGSAFISAEEKSRGEEKSSANEKSSDEKQYNSASSSTGSSAAIRSPPPKAENKTDSIMSPAPGPSNSAPVVANSGNADPGRMRQALPHHLPKLEGLSTKLIDIRKNMGDTGLKAPWDYTGRPLGPSLTSPDPLLSANNNLLKK